MIQLKQALDIMNRKDNYGNPVPFSIKYVKADKMRKTGGKEEFIPCAVIGNHRQNEPLSQINHDNVDVITKHPNHLENMTINLTLLPSKMIRKIHKHLITQLNGEAVYL